ncbi:uncharacterized protein LOC143343153 [Colletes latitarsis]|uniref:uncharacterized protein LOC143343153 n=1 Tax=Colletes latitarsis TaxID=2605962 RepID=UPI004037268C
MKGISSLLLACLIICTNGAPSEKVDWKPVLEILKTSEDLKEEETVSPLPDVNSAEDYKQLILQKLISNAAKDDVDTDEGKKLENDLQWPLKLLKNGATIKANGDDYRSKLNSFAAKSIWKKYANAISDEENSVKKSWKEPRKSDKLKMLLKRKDSNENGSNASDSDENSFNTVPAKVILSVKILPRTMADRFAIEEVFAIERNSILTKFARTKVILTRRNAK